MNSHMIGDWNSAYREMEKHLSTVPDAALLAELRRPEREAVLKTAWSRYTSAKRATRKGWPKGKQRVAAEPICTEVGNIQYP